MEITASSRASLTDAYAPIQTQLERVKGCFDAELASGRTFVNGLCEQVRRYRGKMLRPALLLLSGQATGRLKDDHVVLGAVVEMVHIATLVHDDVLDQADVRRQQTTVNRMSGNEAAVLLGDYLISHAFHLCSSLSSTTAAREIGATTNVVCEGELTQIQHRGDARLTEAEYIDIVLAKTGALTGACCALGARFAGAAAGVAEEMRRFGMDAGIAFQIIDDLLDLNGDEARVGKSLGRDLDLGKLTLPMIHAVANVNEGSRVRLEGMISGRAASDPAEVRRLLNEAGSFEYAQRIAGDYVRSAARRLEGLPDSPARASLLMMVEFILRRDH